MTERLHHAANSPVPAAAGTTAAAARPGLKMQIVGGAVYVKTYPEIGRAAIAAGLATPLRIWTLLRAVDPDGRGVVGYDAAMQTLAFYGLNRWHVRNALKKQAAAGVTFFTVHPTKFEYSSQQHVATALRAGRALTPVLLCADDCHRLARFNSAVYAAWLQTAGARYGGLMISRAKLSELFGVSDTQLRKWERLQNIEVQHNAAKVDFAIDGDSSAPAQRALNALPRDKRLTADRLGRAYTWQRSDGATYYQTVNKYLPRHGYTCRPGMTRKAAKRARLALKTSEAVVDVATARSKYRRVFFPMTYLERQAWQYSVGSSSLLETGATMNGRRRYRRQGALVTSAVKYHVWAFSPMRPALKGRDLCLF